MPFHVGVNLPWFRYGGDFGANAWQPEGGLSQAASAARVEEAFARLAARGLTWVRWWVLGDGRAGLRGGPPGPDPVSLDDRLFADLDAGLAVAERHGLQVMLVLFDFLWFKKRQVTKGVALGGRADLVRQPAALAQLLDAVVRPLFERYKDHPAVWAFDLVNEPEWATFGYGPPRTQESLVGPTMAEFLREMTTLGHQTTNRPITVGLASVSGLPLVRGLGLDLYQVHWYDSVEARNPLARPIGDLGLDAPILLGEFPTRGSARAPRQILETAAAAGYAGALAWSLQAEDPYTLWSPEIETVVSSFGADQAEVRRV